MSLLKSCIQRHWKCWNLPAQNLNLKKQNPSPCPHHKQKNSDVVIGLGGSSIKIGEFVNSIINFLIVAFVLFVVIKFVNSLHKKPEEPAAPEEPTTKVCPYCQSEISIKAVRCPHCTSKLEGFPEMKA